MHRAVRHLVVAAVLAAPSAISAQIVRGPTYTSSNWNPFTLTSWAASAGQDASGNALYRHWFTGTLTMPAMGSFGEVVVAGATETFYLAPWAYGTDPSAPPSPYGVCSCFTYSIGGVATNGFVVTINTRWTMGTILTTLPGFIVPQVQDGDWSYTTYLGGLGGRVIDQDVFGDFSDFFLTADASAPDPNITPEPATLALLGTGLAAVGVVRRRRARAG